MKITGEWSGCTAGFRWQYQPYHAHGRCRPCRWSDSDVDDFRDLSDAVPLLAKVYPNGPVDINAFHQAGGVPLLLRGLANRGLLHMDATPLDWQYAGLFATSAT